MKMIMKKHTGHLDGYAYVPVDINDPSQYFNTNDFPLAVTLMCKGFELITLDRDDTSKKYEFLFEQSGGITNVIDDYWVHRVSETRLSMRIIGKI
jgi:hypothetical protein